MKKARTRGCFAEDFASFLTGWSVFHFASPKADNFYWRGAILRTSADTRFDLDLHGLSDAGVG